jgi:hypothetical protein
MLLSSPLPIVNDNKELEQYSKILPLISGIIPITSNSKNPCQLPNTVNNVKPTSGIFNISTPG